MFSINYKLFELISLVGTLIKIEYTFCKKPEVFPKNILTEDGGVTEFWHYIETEGKLIKRFYRLPKNWMFLTKNISYKVFYLREGKLVSGEQENELGFCIDQENSDGIWEVKLQIKDIKLTSEIVLNSSYK